MIELRNTEEGTRTYVDERQWQFVDFTQEDSNPLLFDLTKAYRTLEGVYDKIEIGNRLRSRQKGMLYVHSPGRGSEWEAIERDCDYEAINLHLRRLYRQLEPAAVDLIEMVENLEFAYTSGDYLNWPADESELVACNLSYARFLLNRVGFRLACDANERECATLSIRFADAFRRRLDNIGPVVDTHSNPPRDWFAELVANAKKMASLLMSRRATHA